MRQSSQYHTVTLTLRVPEGSGQSEMEATYTLPDGHIVHETLVKLDRDEALLLTNRLILAFS